MWEDLKARVVGDAAPELASLRFEFNAPFGTAICVALVIAAGLAVGVYYWRHLKKLTLAPRIVLVGMRAAMVALALFLLLDPCIVGDRFKPGEHYVTLLFDNSKSMEITGMDGLSRAGRLMSAYGASDSDFEQALRRKYQVALYQFGANLERIDSVDRLDFSANQSDLLGAAEDSVRDLSGVDVSAVIVFSDGIQQTDEGEIDLDRLESLGAPVFTVGTDSDSRWADVEIGDLTVNRTDFDSSPVTVIAPVKATGLKGSQAIVEIIIGDRVVKSKRIVLDADEQEHEVRLDFVPKDKGWLEYEARVRLAETGGSDSPDAVANISAPLKDRILQNNSRRFTIDNTQKEYRILYFAGRPNWEHRFLRRALEEDEQLRLTSLIRISRPDRKFVYRGRRASLTNPLFEGFDNAQDQPRYDEAVFLRFGVEESELAKGYPFDAEELFAYDLLIWGDIEFDFFSPDHIDLTREFVRKRGGAWLLLGGSHSFTEGNYAGTPVESMLPVQLRSPTDTDPISATSLARKFEVTPTMDGLLSGAWALDTNPQHSEELWDEMPELAGINLFPITRPGATVHARVRSPMPGIDSAPLFMTQRYGEGKTAILATASTWQWQMQVDVENEAHEKLWRQILRSLVADTPEPIYLRDTEDVYTVGQPVDFSVIIRDRVFEEREGLRASLKVVTPSNEEIMIAVDESIHEAGLYSSEFLPTEPGMHRLLISATDSDDKIVGELETAFLTEPDQREFKKARYDESFLISLAAKTGGKFYRLDQLDQLLAEIPWEDRREPDLLRYHLWHFGPFFFILAAMFFTDWFMRRRRGYA